MQNELPKLKYAGKQHNKKLREDLSNQSINLNKRKIEMIIDKLKSNPLNTINIILTIAALATIADTALSFHKWINKYETALEATLSTEASPPVMAMSGMTSEEIQHDGGTVPEDSQRVFAKAYFGVE